MGKHKISEILVHVALQEKFLSDFSLFVRQIKPYRGAPILSFLRYIKKCKPEEADEIFNKELVFSALFPKEDFKEWKINELYTATYKAFLDFVVYQQLNEKEYLWNLILAEGLMDLNMKSLAIKSLSKILESLLPSDEEESFKVSRKISKSIYNQLKNDMGDKKEKRPHLLLSYKYGKIAATMSSLKVCCELISRKIGLGEEYEEGIEEMIQFDLAHIPYREENLLIDLLAKSAFLLQEPSVEKYFELKKQFFDYVDQLYSEKKEILLHLINVLPFLNLKNLYGEYFELYKFGVEGDYFIEDSKFPLRDFNNIVRISCQINQVVWARKFIETKSPLLSIDDEQLENVQRLYTSYIYFAEKNYAEVLNQMKDLHIEDLSYGLNRHNLLLKCTYELHKHREKEMSSRIIDSYKRYVNKKVEEQYLNPHFKVQIFNFLTIVNLLMAYPYKKNGTKEQLLSKLNSFDGKVIDKIWLEEKINTLKRY